MVYSSWPIGKCFLVPPTLSINSSDLAGKFKGSFFMTAGATVHLAMLVSLHPDIFNLSSWCFTLSNSGSYTSYVISPNQILKSFHAFICAFVLILIGICRIGGSLFHLYFSGFFDRVSMISYCKSKPAASSRAFLREFRIHCTNMLHSSTSG